MATLRGRGSARRRPTHTPSRSSQPTTSSYDCRPYLSGNNETCTINNPSAGTWHIMVRGYTSFSGVLLEASYE